MTGDEKPFSASDPFGGPGSVLAIPAETIAPGERLRPIDRNWMIALGHAMLDEGQHEAIELWRTPETQALRLITGAHRLAAARHFAGLSPIKAVILDARAIRRRIEKACEKLRGLTGQPIARAALVARLWHLLSALHDQAGDEPATSGELAGHLGCPLVVLKRDLRLHAGLAARIGEMLRGHPVRGDMDQLEVLSGLASEEQEKVAYLLLGGAATVNGALAELRRQAVPITKSPRVTAFIEMFERMSMAEKEEALVKLVGLAPSHVSIVWAKR